MRKWHSTEYKLIMHNPNISYKSLAGLIGAHHNTVRRVSNKLGVNHNKKSINTGIPYLSFSRPHGNFIVRVKRKDIGTSANFEKAVGILDAYLYAVKKGWIKQ